jgi:hypothetical protein
LASGTTRAPVPHPNQLQKMKSKILNIFLILTPLIGYLEWGKDSRSFLFQAEAEVLRKLFTDPLSVIHPFTLLPLLGQIILLFTLFQKQPSKRLTLIGMGSVAVLLLFIFVIGLLSRNYKILLSTLPFILTGALTIAHHRRKTEA